MITCKIDAPSSNDVKSTQAKLLEVLAQTTKHINNGSRINIITVNADNPQEMMTFFGSLKWWSLSRVKEKARKGFWAKLGDEVRDLYKYEPFEDK